MRGGIRIRITIKIRKRSRRKIKSRSRKLGDRIFWGEDGDADDGLFEMVGEEIGEPGPCAAEDGVGGLEEPGAAGEEGAVVVEDGDGLAAFAAEILNFAFAEEGAEAGAMEHGW